MMKLNFKIIGIFVAILIIICKGKAASVKKSFIVSFQSGKLGTDSVSADEWIEFSNTIHASKQFTSCQWIKPQYFNKNIAVMLWSYCTIQTDNDTMKCVQMFLQATIKSAKRDLVARGEIQWGKDYTVFDMDLKPFSHRSWAHLCWSLSTVTGENKFYYNGNLLGIDTLKSHENKTLIKSNKVLLDAAFIFGQEQDAMRGGYDLSLIHI